MMTVRLRCVAVMVTFAAIFNCHRWSQSRSQARAPGPGVRDHVVLAALPGGDGLRRLARAGSEHGHVVPGRPGRPGAGPTQLAATVLPPTRTAGPRRPGTHWQAQRLRLRVNFKPAPCRHGAGEDPPATTVCLCLASAWPGPGQGSPDGPPSQRPGGPGDRAGGRPARTGSLSGRLGATQ
jgi:hypothetical protein